MASSPAPVASATSASTPNGSSRGVDITAAPRVVITLASGLVSRMLGERPTARDNAWQAVLADRKRAAQRAELETVLHGAVPSGARNTRRTRG